MINARQWLGFAVLAWVAAILGVVVEAYFNARSRTVFDIYATAARCWWTGEDMYAFRREWFRYSPLFAISISPLAYLPDTIGNAVWKAINAVMFLAGLAAWLRHVVPVVPTRAVVGATFLLTLPGSVHSLHIGQANLLMMGLSFFGLAAAARERWWLAATLIAAATLIKGYPVALALLMSAVYLRSFSWRYVIGMAGGLLTPFLFQFPGNVVFQYQNWFHHLGASGQVLNHERQKTLATLLEQFGYPSTADQFLVAGALAAVIVCGLSLFEKWKSSDSRSILTRMSMLYAVWVVLFCPATESCTYVLIAPGIAWLMAEAFSRRAGLLTCVFLTITLILSGPVATDLFGARVRTLSNDNPVQQIGGLLLLGYLLSRTNGPLITRVVPAMVPVADEYDPMVAQAA